MLPFNDVIIKHCFKQADIYFMAWVNYTTPRLSECNSLDIPLLNAGAGDSCEWNPWNTMTNYLDTLQYVSIHD